MLPTHTPRWRCWHDGALDNRIGMMRVWVNTALGGCVGALCRSVPPPPSDGLAWSLSPTTHGAIFGIHGHMIAHHKRPFPPLTLVPTRRELAAGTIAVFPAIERGVLGCAYGAQGVGGVVHLASAGLPPAPLNDAIVMPAAAAPIASRLRGHRLPAPELAVASASSASAASASPRQQDASSPTDSGSAARRVNRTCGVLLPNDRHHTVPTAIAVSPAPPALSTSLRLHRPPLLLSPCATGTPGARSHRPGRWRVRVTKYMLGQLTVRLMHLSHSIRTPVHPCPPTAHNTAGA
jgi:hypothetical protein